MTARFSGVRTIDDLIKYLTKLVKILPQSQRSLFLGDSENIVLDVRPISLPTLSKNRERTDNAGRPTNGDKGTLSGTD